MDKNIISNNKRLFLLRHATSDNVYTGSDESRPLSKQGKDEALALGQYMKNNGFIPNIVLCSSAKRTRETLEQIQKSIKIDNIVHLDILYTGSTGHYFAQIQQCGNQYNNIMLIGHNPAIYALINFIAIQNDAGPIMRLGMGYSPATLSILKCQQEKWADIQPESCVLQHIASPIDYNTAIRPTRWM